MADAYAIDLTPRALADLQALRAFDRAMVTEAISRYLAYEPTRVSKSRIKRMAQPFWSQFRLRVGEYRVYYDVDESARQVIVVRVVRKGAGSTPDQESS